MNQDIHSFEDAIEFCFAAVDDSKTIEEAHKKIEGYLALVHERKFEMLRTEYAILLERPEKSGRVRGRLNVETAKKLQIDREQVTQSENAEIEYETVTLRVPKKIMDFMRTLPQAYPGPVEWLEYSIVDHIRADLEAATSEEMIGWFGLGPIFKAILEDKQFP